MKKRFFGLLLIVGLFVGTLAAARAVRADYTGPNRHSHTTGGYHNVKMSINDAYVCTYIYTCGDDIGDIPGVQCSSGVCASLASGSTYYYVEDVPGQTVTDPPATAEGSVNCTTPGNNGWCRDGNLTFTANEPVNDYVISAIETDLWGYVCQPNTASPTCTYDPGDGSGTVVFWAESTYGDSSDQHTLSWEFDATPPTLSVSAPGPDGQNGWFVSSPVSVNANGNDTVSGLASLQCRADGGAWQSPPLDVAGDGVHAVECRAEDNAGNTANWSDTVKVDTTPPTATPTTNGTLGDNGWYTSTATVQANASDPTSGVASVAYQVDDGAWQSGNSVTLGDGVHTVAFRVTDNAGNVTATSAQTVKVDTTAPTITPSLPPPDGQNGWFVSSPVQVGASGSDTLSGLAALQCRVDSGTWQTPPVDVAGDGVHAVECRAEDNAGNTTTWSETVKVDTTPPTASLSMPAPGGQNDWYVSSPIQVDANGSDALSGLALVQCSVDGGAWQAPPVDVSGDGVHTVECRAEDDAGNVYTSNPATLKIDTGAPTMNPQVPVADGQNGWFVTAPVSVNASGDDATSGLASLQCRADGGAWQAPPVAVDGDGTHTVDCQAEDNAGNTASWSDTLQIDTTVPSVMPSVPVADGRNGWFVSSPVNVDASGSDATSGLALVQCQVDNGVWQAPPVDVSGDGVHTAECQAEDNAGNVSTWSETVKVDTTPPTSVFSAPAEGATVWGIVTLQGVTDDPASGAASVEISTDDGTTWQPATLVASTGHWTAFWDTRPLPDGDYTLLAHAQDEAGNEEHTAVRHVTVANAPPQVSLHPGRWYSWQTAQASITPNPYIPLKSVTVSILGPAGHVRRWHYGDVQRVDIHWNTRWYSENGAWAHPGKYRVVVEAVDVYGHTGSAEGTVIVPQPAPTATPTATASATPTAMPTPTATVPPVPVSSVASPTATPVVIALTPTPRQQVVVATPKPPAPRHTPVVWLAGAVAVLGIVLTLDPRPREIRALTKTLQKFEEVHHD